MLKQLNPPPRTQQVSGNQSTNRTSAHPLPTPKKKRAATSSFIFPKNFALNQLTITSLRHHSLSLSPLSSLPLLSPLPLPLSPTPNTQHPTPNTNTQHSSLHIHPPPHPTLTHTLTQKPYNDAKSNPPPHIPPPRPDHRSAEHNGERHDSALAVCSLLPPPGKSSCQRRVRASRLVPHPKCILRRQPAAVMLSPSESDDVDSHRAGRRQSKRVGLWRL